MLVSIMRQGDFLIASVHTALDDTELLRFQEELVDQVGACRARGIIIDVATLDVLDSFGSRSLRNLAQMARLRGAATVLVGVQPDVAFAIVELGMDLDLNTAADLEDGMAYLETVTRGKRTGSSTLDVLREEGAR